jgi:hypothetical protein
MTTNIYPANWLAKNNQTSKLLSLVFQMDGVPFYLTSGVLNKKIRYGDPIVYGQPGIVYGGLIERTDFKPLINLNSSMTIGQKVEPEQGKGSITLMSLAFTDKNSLMSQLISPGVIVNEPLGNKFVKIWLGFQDSSFPEDYIVIMRAFVSGTMWKPAEVTLQLSDPNIKRKSPIFFTNSQSLVQSIGTGDTVIPFAGIQAIYQQILGPGLTYDPAILTYIKIDDEFIGYGPAINLTAPLNIISGIDQQNFYVSPSDAGKCTVGCVVGVSNSDGSSPSSQVILTAANNSTGQITVDVPLGFVPSPGQIMTGFSGVALNLNVLSGIDNQNFYVSPGDASRLLTGDVVALQNLDGSQATGPFTILSVNAGTGQVTLLNPLPYIPMTGQIAVFYALVVQQRGARGTTAAAHTPDSSGTGNVTNIIQIQDNVIQMALKLMLSGWAGPYLTGQACASIVNTLDPTLGNVPNTIVLPSGVDAVIDLGLANGDWVTVSGSLNGNNGSYQIIDIEDTEEQPNRLLYVNATLNLESPASSVSLAFRSQFDVYPVLAGQQMAGFEVDVAGHVTAYNNFFSQNENRMRFLVQEQANLKTFIETELFLPVGAYSITRYGQCSIAVTKPPIADQKLIVLDKTNVMEPGNIQVARSLNTRRYFDEIDYMFDLNDDNSTYQSTVAYVNTQSLSNITISSPLPITSKGLRSDLGAALVLLPRQSQFLLNRFGNAAFEITLKLNFETISQLETGDVVDLRDNGDLQILNLSTGVRNIGEQLMEVIDRQLDIKSGNGQVTLLSAIGVDVTDRFATISPSSIVAPAGSGLSNVVIQESFGAFFPLNEQNKWIPNIGLPIIVHSPDYTTRYGTAILTAIDPSNNHNLQLASSLGFVPQPGDIVEIDNYPTDNNPDTEKFYKQVYCHIDPSVAVVTGIDLQNFTVAPADIGKFNVGLPVSLHNFNYSISSAELEVTAVNLLTYTVTVAAPGFAFVPSAGLICELIGFADGGGPYRII